MVLLYSCHTVNVQYFDDYMETASVTVVTKAVPDERNEIDVVCRYQLTFTVRLDSELSGP